MEDGSKKIVDQEESGLEAAPQAIARPLIYCGPNLPRGVLLQYTVFKGGIPRYLDSHIGACPAIKRLCVPVADMAKTVQAIDKKGSAECVWFEQVQNYKGGGK